MLDRLLLSSRFIEEIGMKKAIAAAVLLAGLSASALADVYAGPQTFSTTGTLVMGLGSAGTVVLTAGGSPTSPTFTIQGSSDPADTVSAGAATWTTLPAFPVAGGSSVTSLTTTGVWAVATTGMSRVRVNLTALSGGSIIFTLDGGPAPCVPCS